MKKDKLNVVEETSKLWGGATVKDLVSRIKRDWHQLKITGLMGSSLAFVLSQLLKVLPKQPVVVITKNHKKAYQLYEDLLFYAGEWERSSSRISYYPADEMLPYSEVLPDRGASQGRLGSLLKLQQDVAPVLVMSASAAIRRVPPARELNARSDLVQVAEEFEREEFIENLIDGGYRRVPVVEDKGTFSVRGDIIDLFSPLYNHPTRIQLDDFLVESIRFFEPNTQRTLDEIDEIFVVPVDESLFSLKTLGSAQSRFADLADQLEYPTQKLNALFEDLKSGLRPFGLQGLMPGFYPKLQSLFDYLPKDAILILDEWNDLASEVKSYNSRMKEAYQHFVDEGGFAFPPQEFVLDLNEFQHITESLPHIHHNQLFLLDNFQQKSPDDSPSIPQQRPDLFPFASTSHKSLKQILTTQAPTQEHRLQPLVDQIKRWQEEKLHIAIVCASKGQALRLQELLKFYSLKAKIFDQTFHYDLLTKKNQEEICLFIGRVTEGFLLPSSQLVVISEEEIFGSKVRKKRPKKKKILQNSELQALQTGDFVIHREHGVARYGGLHTITIEGVTSDFILLEYQGKDRLYLPVTRLGLIERYSGGTAPKLDRLRSSSFAKKKSKARAAIRAMAGELLQLYAERKVHQRPPYPAPDEMYHQFAASFPFEETPDQQSAIDDILADMQSPQVMDRLICGDVGYGKTEVAMRAIFHAVMSGKQVAVLVPTTVLAQQHGLTFMERFEGYPFKIAVLSRFQSKKEHKKIIEELKNGSLDIVVGTHRLFSRDVHFKNLGLLVIDEEHRFGVRHKEKIKQFKRMVDVITLTATPIPRTLEMSLMGIRDLSLITTPPHDRLSIRTIIAPFGDQVIRETIMRELNRGGQVFFVHNRVQSIAKLQDKLTKLVPEARIVVGHGQMPEEELERVMLDFVKGKYDLLLSTSIIESGLDIPRANTIIINRADTFGLAQLYQIRGRVGRGKERAYALLLVPTGGRITPEAKQRLTTLQRFSELGAGFDIARYDLEFRGAGNILGKQQSGHIHAIGMELYFEIFEETIAELQGQKLQQRIDPEVKLGIDAYIPDKYIPDIQLRLQCYRRLSSAETTDELDEMSLEFVDRFGEMPPEVEALFQTIEIKQMLSKLFVISATLSNNKLRIFFAPEAPLNFNAILQLAQQKNPPFKLIPNDGLEIKIPPSDDDFERFSAIRTFLRPLYDQILLPSQEKSV